MRVLFVDLCAGEPARHALRGVRAEQATRAARLLGVERSTLGLQDRMITDTVDARYAEAFRARRPLLVADPSVFVPARFG